MMGPLAITGLVLHEPHGPMQGALQNRKGFQTPEERHDLSNCGP